MGNLLEFEKINIAMQTNAFIYYLSRIPVIGKFIGESWFRAYRMKKVFALFGIALDLIKEAIGYNIGLYIILCVIPNALLKDSRVSGNQVLFLFLMVSCIASAVSGHGLFKPQSEDYTFLTHFMVDPDSYYKYKALKNALYCTVLYLPVFLYITRSVMLSLMMVCLKLLFVMGSGVVYLRYFKRFHKIPGKLWRNIGLLLCVALAYLGIYFGLVPEFHLDTTVMAAVMAVSLLGSLACCVYHGRYTDYKKIAVTYANLATLRLQVSVHTAAVGEDSTGMQEEAWEENADFYEKNKTLEPWVYFEKAFRHRYRKILFHDRLSWAAIMLAAALFLTLAVRGGWLSLSGKNIFEYTPVLLALAAASSFAGRLMQMLFRNIDVFILDGKFATREYVRQSMLGRYLYVIRSDALYSLFFLGVAALTGQLAGLHLGAGQLVSIVLLFFLFLFLWDTYEVLTYYLFQPFSKEMAVRNPVYAALGWLEGIFSLVVLFVRKDITRGIPFLVALDVLAVCVFFLVRRYAWKTFRLR
ncbi:MAG: hypothetical protein NC517_05075 [Firmicutes bacterium]|nr:hypothetical protein [Bacillota bacterium]